VAEIADGVVVGSAIVKFIENNAADPALPEQAWKHSFESLARPLRSA
jgi:tryptophan synthase alpha subunit